VSHPLTNQVHLQLLTFNFFRVVSMLLARPVLSSHLDIQELDDSDGEVETEEEFLDSAQLADLAQRFPSYRMSAALAVEVCRIVNYFLQFFTLTCNFQRAMWDDSTDSTRASVGSMTVVDTLSSQESSGGSAAMPTAPGVMSAMNPTIPAPLATPPVMPDALTVPVAMPVTPAFAMPAAMPIALGVTPNKNQAMWPAETDLIFVPGTNKVMLMAQHPLIRTVIQDGIENVRASLLFEDAFPDATSIPAVTRDALIDAAWSHIPRALGIHSRLQGDDEYVARMSRLVSTF
jgi:hypothetical protein